MSWLVLAVCLPGLGCKKESSTSTAPSAASVKVPAPEQRAVPATQKEAEDFARRFHLAAMSGVGQGELVDWQAMAGLALEGLHLPDAQQDLALNRMAHQFFGNLQAALRRGGSYTLLSNRSVGGERRVKFRLITSDGAFNHHDLVLNKRNGKVQAVDIHVLLTGEPMSQTLRRALLPVAVEANQSVWDRLTKAESAYVKSLPKIGQMTQPGVDALAIYRSLPNEVQRDKNVLILRVQAALQASDADYLSALEDFRRYHPKDVAVDVMSIDYFYMKKRIPEALAALDRVDKTAGPDAHLHTLRAGLFIEAKQFDKAMKALDKALALEPDLSQARVLSIALALAQHRESDALAHLVYCRKHHLSLGELLQNPDYQRFIAKPDVHEKLAAVMKAN